MLPKFLSFVLLLSVLLGSPARAQSWVSTLDTGGGGIGSIAVSPGGRIALLTPREGGIAVLRADGSLEREFVMADPGGDYVALVAATFRDEATLVVAGSVGQRPYMAAIDLATGLAEWESELTYKGQFRHITGTGQGQFVGLGAYHDGENAILACSINATGGVLWFREYVVGPAHDYSSSIDTFSNGDLLMALHYSAGWVLTRTTNFGHEIWSKRYTSSARSLYYARAAVTSTDDIVLGSTAYDSLAGRRKHNAMRLDGQGEVKWFNEYELPALGGADAELRNAVACDDGGVLLGVGLRNPLTGTDTVGGLRLRPDGSVLWLRDFGTTPSPSRLLTFAPATAGGFVAVSAVLLGNPLGYAARILRGSAGGDVGPCTGGFSPVSTSTLPITVTDNPFTFGSYPGGIGSRQLVPVLVSSPLTTVCGLQVPPASSYCAAKVNSQGCTPAIGSTGNASASGAGITVTADQVLNNKVGLLFWGRAAAGTPFQGGTKCVGGATRRTPIQSSAGNAAPNDCSGTYAFTFDPVYMAAKGIAPGETIYSQYWSRDPALGSSTGLTDGLQFTVSP